MATCWWTRAIWPGRWPPTGSRWRSGDGWPRPIRPTPAWQRDLSVSHDRVGDVLRTRAIWPGRWPPTRQSLEIRRRLAARDPANTDWQRDLSVSHDKAGRRAAGPGDLAAALAAYRASLDVDGAGWPPPTRQRRLAARPERQPRTSWATCCGGRAIWPGRWPPTRQSLDIDATAGRRRPVQRRLAARPEREPQQAGRRAAGQGDLAAALAAYQAVAGDPSAAGSPPIRRTPVGSAT